MAQIVSYATLKDEIIAYFVRTGDTDFATRIDTFIGLAEAGFNRNIRSRHMLTTATLTTDADGFVALPADYVVGAGAFVDNGSYSIPLNFIGGNATATLFPIPNTGGEPYDISISGTSLNVFPTLSRDIVLTYYAKFVGLSLTNATNWIITNHPDLYQFAVMTHACIYQRDDTGASLFGAQTQAIESELMGLFNIETYFNAGITLTGDTP